MSTQKPQLKSSRPNGARNGNDDVLAELRHRIANHDLPPGARLREQDLANEFGVSRARIRDAFGVLEQRGLIERMPHRGAIVARLEDGTINELFEVREALEAHMVRLATEKAPPGSWDQFAELFGPIMHETLSAGDFEAYEDAVHRFRQRCIEEADNAVLSDLLDSIFERTHVLIRRLVLLPGRAQEGAQQHQEIIAAMQAGNAEEAERLKRANIRSARAWFQTYRKYLI